MIEIEPSTDQISLRKAAAAFMNSAAPMTRLREMIDNGVPFESTYLRDAGELGWFSVLCRRDGDDPGRVTGLADAAIVAEERGARLQPGTFVPMNVLALTLDRWGSREQRRILDDVQRGAGAAWAVTDREGHFAPNGACAAVRDGDHWVLDGVSGLVQDARTADWILVMASDGDLPAVFLLPSDTAGLRIEPLESLDLTRRFDEVHFDSVEVDATAQIVRPDDSPETIRNLVETQLRIAVALTVSESVGAMDRLFATSLQYAKTRVAFGRPIGSFQSIKHLLADTSVTLETSKALAAAAIRAVLDGHRDADQITSMAKSFIGDAGVELAHACWQTHGGVAYRWDHEFHLYLRRLTTDASLYGDPAWHRERICRLNGLAASEVQGGRS
jgi:alkylation response protein AidB-like acyl-CoA dehydrogenase